MFEFRNLGNLTVAMGFELGDDFGKVFGGGTVGEG
jgi:hypothetical protein